MMPKTSLEMAQGRRIPGQGGGGFDREDCSSSVSSSSKQRAAPTSIAPHWQRPLGSPSQERARVPCKPCCWRISTCSATGWLPSCTGCTCPSSVCEAPPLQCDRDEEAEIGAETGLTGCGRGGFRGSEARSMQPPRAHSVLAGLGWMA